MPENIQTTTQLYSSHLLARSCSKFSKISFNSMWTENFQMYKLDLEKTEEPETKLPTPAGSQKKQGDSRKTSASASLTTLKLLTVWITTNCGKFLKRWEYQNYLTCLLRNLYADQEATVRIRHGMMDWFKTGKGVRQGCILPLCLSNLYAEYIMQNARLNEAQVGINVAGRNYQ